MVTLYRIGPTNRPTDLEILYRVYGTVLLTAGSSLSSTVAAAVSLAVTAAATLNTITATTTTATITPHPPVAAMVLYQLPPISSFTTTDRINWWVGGVQ